MPSLLPPMKWNAWGDPGGGQTALRRDPHPARAGRSASSAIGCRRADADQRAPAAVGAAATPTATRWPPSSASAYCVSDDRGRLLRAGGKSTLDLLRRKDSGVQDAPDAVLLPADEDEIADVLELLRAAQHRRRPVRWRHQRGRRPRPDPRGLQGRRLAGSAAPRRSCTASTRSPARPNSAPESPGPDAEQLLGERGFSLGHFPQSFQFATIGGFAATRSSGQDSAGYGRFDDMVRGLRLVTPAGVLDLGRAPASAAGPDLRQLIIGLGGRVRRHHQGAGAGTPRPGDHPLRGVVVPRLRHRRRGAARRRPDWHRPHGDAAFRRGRDRRQPGHHRDHRRAAASPAAAWRSPRSRAPRHTPRAGTPRLARVLAAHGGTSLGDGAGEGLGARPVRRALPARLAAGGGRAVRDAGDRDQLVEPRPR